MLSVVAVTSSFVAVASSFVAVTSSFVAVRFGLDAPFAKIVNALREAVSNFLGRSKADAHSRSGGCCQLARQHRASPLRRPRVPGGGRESGSSPYTGLATARNLSPRLRTG